MKRIDLNVDLGEGCPWDKELLEFATSANVCCGAHAGSAEFAIETARMCRKMGVRVGAHPGYPDSAHFGRRPWSELDTDLQGEVMASVLAQAAILDGRFAYIKPHGGLYNDSARGGVVGATVATLLGRYSVPLMGLAGSFHETVAQTVGVKLIREGFADRRYGDDGLLVPRSEPGAILNSKEEKVAQALWLAERVDSICMHGDEEDSVATIQAVREALERSGWEVGH